MSQISQAIVELVQRFEQNIESYRSPAYNETQLRREFIDPFFEALGWDVTNKQGYAEAYKDVIHEDAIKIGSATKAPDYCFRIGGVRKFFVETKKPAVSVKDDVSPAYQLRRYAWSAKFPLSILTDFEEFAVYDCRIPPKPNDKPSVGRILYLTYNEYATRWEEIVSIFSKDAVLRGSFDKFVVSGKGRRGTSEVDAAFLTEIEAWREALARNLALRNPNLTVRELNFAVQRTIDRIIFLRMCEDRGIEQYGQLQALLNGEDIYGRLRYIYGLADDRYNSGLFHFKPEKGRAEAPDELTPTLTVDDKVLKDIIRRLYYPESPYEFSVLSADILGNVYEQFLGKVIRLTAGHRAVIEEKPEVKKAGGVYYTPTYIVDYIVKNTVGKLCEEKTPKQIAKLKILDPACGSGSFLVGAYTYLLNYHRDWYVKDGPEKHTKEIYQGAGGQWFLTTQEKKRILLNNIFGVDIDSQAVEVTKLSLLLKVLENENQQTIASQLRMWRERALPDLGSNIKCGNSLIGPDYYAGRQTAMFDDEEVRRVNAFDWNAEFPEIMKAGGFDAVIGNPPYGAQFSDSEKNYLFIKYPHIKGQPESYEYFLFRSLGLTTKNGFLSFIIPTNFIESERAEGLRDVLLRSGHIQLLSSFRYNVWKKNAAETLVIVYQKGAQRGVTHVVHPESPNEFINEVGSVQVNQVDWRTVPGKRFLIRADINLIKKIETGKVRLDEICDLAQGIIVYKTREDSARNLYIASKRKGPEWKKLLDTNSSIQRYNLYWGKKYLKYGDWLWCPRDPKYFEQPKILFVRLRNKALPRKLIGTYDEERFYNRDNFNNIILKDMRYSLKYILGLFNSNLLNYWYKAYFDNVNINPAQVRLIPICPINFSDKNEKECHDQMVFLVDRMLDLHKKLNAAKTPDDKTRLQRQIDATDNQIDQLVYELYGLTEEEIAIVEGTPVASKAGKWDNVIYESSEVPHRSHQAERQATEVAKTAQYTGKTSRCPSESDPGTGRPVHGVRERTGEYGSSQGPSEEKEDSQQIDSTRLLDTAEGPLSYPQVSERIAGALARILSDILQNPSDQIAITPEWICLQHKALACSLFPDWAGRYRDVNVQVGTHMPPPFYEVPGLMRLFCDDLTERLRHVQPGQSTVADIADLLAWMDWRFQWIHPFKDFNGRIGRVLLAALMYKLALPHVETAPLDPDARRQYLDALRAADSGDLRPLTDLWIQRIEEAL